MREEPPTNPYKCCGCTLCLISLVAIGALFAANPQVMEGLPMLAGALGAIAFGAFLIAVGHLQDR